MIHSWCLSDPTRSKSMDRANMNKGGMTLSEEYSVYEVQREVCERVGTGTKGESTT